jgi:PAS domain S-box-containing protein
MLLLPDYRVRQRDYLLEISRALTSQLNLDTVLRMILKAAVSMLAAEVGLIALRERHAETDALYPRAFIGVDASKVDLFSPLLQEVSDEGLNYTQLDPKVRQVARALDMKLKQVIALPMIMRGEIVGVIYIFRTYEGQSDANDRMVLQSFADQAAVAVHNAKMYQSVSAEQQRLAAILDNSADGIMILDPLRRIIRFNKALARICGCQPIEALGEPHDKVIGLVRVDEGTALTNALEQGWPQARPVESVPDTLYVEGDLKRPDGSIISVGITYAPLLDMDGSLINVIANVRDITHFRQAQEMKSTFISVISHELKTPVALIKGWTSTLRRDDAEWDSETIQRGLAVIEDEADRLTELIENLLAVSKMQVEGMRITAVDDVHLDQIAQRSIDRFKTQTTIHTLRANFPEKFPCIVGDAVRLRQVIDNLVNNAIKYSPKGGEIRISGTYDDHSVTVAVSDPGIGIPADEQDRIFDRFYRVDDTLTRSTQGTGLGLFLARAVVEAHHGVITVESQPGKGSTFRLTLPRDQQVEQSS